MDSQLRHGLAAKFSTAKGCVWQATTKACALGKPILASRQQAGELASIFSPGLQLSSIMVRMARGLMPLRFRLSRATSHACNVSSRAISRPPVDVSAGFQQLCSELLASTNLSDALRASNGPFSSMPKVPSKASTGTTGTPRSRSLSLI